MIGPSRAVLRLGAFCLVQLIVADSAQWEGAGLESGAGGDARRAIGGLVEAASDLEAGGAKDAADLRLLEGQIVALVRRRDEERKDEAKKQREAAFLRGEAARLRKRARLRDESAAAGVAGAGTEDAVEVRAPSEAGAQLQAGGLAQRAQEVGVAADSADAADDSVKDANLTSPWAAATPRQAAAPLAAAQRGTQMMTAERSHEEVTGWKAASEAAAQADGLAQQRSERGERARQGGVAMDSADSADDSFKEYMKEEDGEDQQGDSDYEDSANALAGAIGWNRNEIETKANKAVKQLTEAIGGKKVVQSLQGMMAGIR